MKYMNSACKSMLITVSELNMFKGVKRLGIGLSGGADSLALLDCIVYLLMQENIPKMEMLPIHINQFNTTEDIGTLIDYVQDKYDLNTHIFEADSTITINSLLKAGKAPCHDCARIREQALAEFSSILNLDALTISHNLDDVITTLLLNIFHKGKIDTMRPVTSRKYNKFVPILRPFYFTKGSIVKKASPLGPQGLFNCPFYDTNLAERERVRVFVETTFNKHKVSAFFVKSKKR